MSEKLNAATNNDAFNQQKFKYAKEAREKWGDTDLFHQSQRKMAQYSQQKMNEINHKQLEIYRALAEFIPCDVAEARVQELVHQARMLINDYWYTCDKQQFADLGQMYVSDERFKNYFDQIKAGLAEFMNQAIQIYCKID